MHAEVHAAEIERETFPLDLVNIHILTFFMVSDYICQEDEVKLIDEDET